MNFYFALIATAALFITPLQADIYKEQRTGIEFPESVGDLKRGKVTPYSAEPNKAGVAIEYRTLDTELTVYVRALGDDLGKNATDFLKDSLSAIKALEAQGQYSKVNTFEFMPDREKPNWKSAGLTLYAADGFLISFVHCRIVSGHLVKIRATTSNTRVERLYSLTKSLQEIVDNSATKP